MKSANPRVVAAACRVRDERVEGKTLNFRAEGIGDTNAVVRIAALKAPAAVTIGGQPAEQSQYDFAGGTLRLRFANSVQGIPVEIRFA